jgi:hypothetical protein
MEEIEESVYFGMEPRLDQLENVLDIFEGLQKV